MGSRSYQAVVSDPERNAPVRIWGEEIKAMKTLLKAMLRVCSAGSVAVVIDGKGWEVDRITKSAATALTKGAGR